MISEGSVSLSALLASCASVEGQERELVRLDREVFTAGSTFLQREILAAIWRQQGWPEQSMGFEEWSRLVTAIAANRPITMPGNIQLRSTDREITIRRVAVDAS